MFSCTHRYFAIVYPFHTLIYLKRHKSRVLILIWIVAVLLSSVMLFQSKAVPFTHGNETYYDCRELWDDEQGKYFTIAVFVVTFGLPVSALVFVYTSIGVHIIRRTAPGNPDLARDMVQWVLKIKVSPVRRHLSAVNSLSLTAGHQNAGHYRHSVRGLLAAHTRGGLHPMGVPTDELQHIPRLSHLCAVLLCLPLACHGSQLPQSVHLRLHERKL